MKLLTFVADGPPRLGALIDSRVVDLERAYLAWPQRQGTPEQAHTTYLGSLLAFLQAGSEAWRVARDILRWVESSAPASQDGTLTFPLSDVRIGPPLPNPSKVIGIGLNYADHCREQNLEPPTSPILFAKFPSTLIGPHDSNTLPAGGSEQVDFEAELAVVIGRAARRVSVEQAGDYVAGYTVANDVSARDVQFSDKQWVRGKSFDTFCPIGPFLVTPDEVGDPHRLAIRCRVNGQVMQDSNTAEMIFKVPDLISFISRTSTLLPGDIICTGTPNGVGFARKPPVFLKPGDVVEVEIERLGLLSNPVGALEA